MASIDRTKGQDIFNIFNMIFMVALMLVTLYPLLYVVFASFSDAGRFLAHSGMLWHPLGFSGLAYERAFQHPSIVSGYLNTIFIVVIGTILSVMVTAIGAYFLSRKNVLLQRPIAFLIMFTMFFSGGLIPTYFVVKNFLGGVLYDSLWALIVPTMVSTYNLVVMRSGFAAIPDSLEESARIDGAGHLTILFKIVLPLAKATVAVIVLYYGVAYWNAWFNASIYINDNAKYPLQLVLRQILLINDTNNMTFGVDAGDQMAISETIKYAVIVIATLPILCVYPFLQKYFVKGVMIGAVKG